MDQEGQKEADEKFQAGSGGNKEKGDPKRMAGNRVTEELIIVSQSHKGALKLRQTQNDPVKAQNNGLANGPCHKQKEYQ